MPQNLLLLLASKMKTVKISSNTLICKQGEEQKHIYFVKSGSIKVVRDVTFHPLHYYQNVDNAQSN